MAERQLALYSGQTPRPNNDYLRALPQISAEQIHNSIGIPSFQIDIPYAISELSYLTHNFYRYYGKFPSVLGGYLIDEYASSDVVFDNYLGCGTTSVEATIRGLKVSGIDINPIAILATKLKTRVYHKPERLADFLFSITTEARSIPEDSITIIPQWKDISKWFSPNNITKLAKIQSVILSRQKSEDREFAVLCFLAIIRRCSNAYDGEVRPHINPRKKPRDPFEAFEDKARDMLKRARTFSQIVPEKPTSEAFCASNTEGDLAPYLPFGKPSLTISHPPYLNCFNYYSVFSLENNWSYCFPEARQNVSEDWIKSREHKCWPATKQDIITSYFENLKRAYTILRENVSTGSFLAIVIGDSTLRKRLIPVHNKLIEELPKCGFDPYHMLYRTTHYGIGKYAYRTRADYHGDSPKRDGVIVARAS